MRESRSEGQVATFQDMYGEKEKGEVLYMNKQKLVDFTVKHYNKQQAVGNTGYTPTDALVSVLEEFDTGYDLTEPEWKELENAVIEACK